MGPRPFMQDVFAHESNKLHLVHKQRLEAEMRAETLKSSILRLQEEEAKLDAAISSAQQHGACNTGGIAGVPPGLSDVTASCDGKPSGSSNSRPGEKHQQQPRTVQTTAKAATHVKPSKGPRSMASQASSYTQIKPVVRPRSSTTPVAGHNTRQQTLTAHSSNRPRTGDSPTKPPSRSVTQTKECSIARHAQPSWGRSSTLSRKGGSSSPHESGTGGEPVDFGAKPAGHLASNPHSSSSPAHVLCAVPAAASCSGRPSSSSSTANDCVYSVTPSDLLQQQDKQVHMQQRSPDKVSLTCSNQDAPGDRWRLQSTGSSTLPGNKGVPGQQSSHDIATNEPANASTPSFSVSNTDDCVLHPQMDDQAQHQQDGHNFVQPGGSPQPQKHPQPEVQSHWGAAAAQLDPMRLQEPGIGNQSPVSQAVQDTKPGDQLHSSQQRIHKLQQDGGTTVLTSDELNHGAAITSTRHGLQRLSPAQYGSSSGRVVAKDGQRCCASHSSRTPATGVAAGSQAHMMQRLN